MTLCLERAAHGQISAHPTHSRAATLRGAAAGGHLRRCRSSTMSPHRLRRGALHLPTRRSRQKCQLILARTLSRTGSSSSPAAPCDPGRLQRHCVPAPHIHQLPRDPSRLLRSEEYDRVSNILGSSHPAQGNLSQEPLLEFRRYPACLDGSQRYDVHGDPILAQFMSVYSVAVTAVTSCLLAPARWRLY